MASTSKIKRRKKFLETSFCEDGFTKCQFCGREIHKIEETKKGRHKVYSLDHATPTCRGGKDEYDNYLVACRPCNRKKGGLTVEEFDTLKLMAKGEAVTIEQMLQLINGIIEERGMNVSKRKRNIQ